MRKEKSIQSLWSVACPVLCFVFLAATLQGCEPLRKKFTRHKKGEEVQKEYEPILDPIDYPDKVYDPQADYRYRFSLFQVWETELLAGMNDQASAKRLQSFLQNILIQLQEMDKLVVEEKRSGLQKAMQGYQRMIETLKQPSQFYNLRDLRIEAERLAKPILLGFKPSVMKESIKPQKIL